MELTIENLIKIIIGVLVVVAVSYGLYHFFSNNFIGLFGNTEPESTGKLIIALLR